MVHLGDAGQQNAKMDRTMVMTRNFMKFVAIGIIPVTASFETGVFVYWLTSNFVSVTQTLLLRNPRIRAMVGMPPAPRNPDEVVKRRADYTVPARTYTRRKK